MSSFGVTNRVYVRSDYGRFLSKYERAKQRVIEDTVKEGSATARALAPKRSGKLAASIKSTTGTSGGSWAVGTGYGQVQEKGGPPHRIKGNVSFFWVKKGRNWRPGRNWINHPGNPGVHFMERSYDIVAPRMVEKLRAEMR